MRNSTKRLLLWILLGALASAGIAMAIFLIWNPGEDLVRTTAWGKPVEFLEPEWFYLAAVVPFFFVVASQSLTDLSVSQQMLQATLRSVVVVGIAIALARPAWTTSDNKVATVVLVDVSDSVSDKQLESARQYVANLDKSRGEKDKLYVVTFAERPQVARKKEGVWIIGRHGERGKGTDIQSAMQLAYGLYPIGYLPRAVILSDGNQTRGDLLVESYRAQKFGVKVSWKTFPGDRVKEIRVLAVKMPDEVKQKQPFFVTAEVWSTHSEKVKLALHRDYSKTPLETKTVDLHEGANKVKFKTEVDRAGFTHYAVKLVDVKGDTEKGNNVASATTPVKGKPQVLYVEGGRRRFPGSSQYLARALEHQNMEVQTRGPRGLPGSLEELKKFDMVIVSDVPAQFVSMAQMNALEAFVRVHGGGLLMAGGEDSFGSGGYQGTRMEKIMPVRFDSEKQREQPNVAIALVIDRSGSMGGSKIEAAKESARATAEVLNPGDLITVIAFDNSASTIVRLQRAANRFRISTDIARIQAAGGTHILPGLKEAYDALLPANAKVKHVILLSDGQAPYSGIVDLVQEMQASRITVSSVGIGDADRNLLSMIATNGGGRLYMTDDLSALPRIFMKETTEKKKSALIEDLVTVHVVKRVDMIEGTGVGGAPPLRGYVSTKPKPTSEVVLISDLGEPVLARWRVGAGTSVAWTSDVKNRWAVEWVRWGGYSKFWAQIVRSSMRRKQHDGYDMYTKIEDGRAIVTIDAVDARDRFVNNLDTELRILHPKGKVPPRIVPMKQTAAGRYTAEFDIDRYGSYNLVAVHHRGSQKVAESRGSVTLPYPREYLRTTPNEAPLAHAAMVTQGLDKPEPAKIWKTQKGEHIKYTEDLWPWVLLFVAMAIIVDTFVKRVRLFGYRTIKF